MTSFGKMKILILAILAFLGALPCAAQVTALSGGHGPGRSHFGVGPVNSGSYPFVNFVKGCTGSYGSTGNFVANWGLNDDGYPTKVGSGSYGCAFYAPASYNNGSNQWIIAWAGSLGTGSASASSGLDLQFNQAGAGPIQVISGAGFVASGTTTTQIFLYGSNGAVTFVPPSGTSRIQIDYRAGATGSYSPTNLAICRADQVANAAACLANQANQTSPLCSNTFTANRFDPDYLCQEATLNPRIIRFQKWQNSEGTIRSRHADDPPVTSQSYGNEQWPARLQGGVATYCASCGPGSLEQYTVSAPPNAATDCGANPYPCDGSTVQFYSNNANTGGLNTNVYFVVGSSTPAPIYQFAGGSYSRINVAYVKANELYTFVYDAKLQSWLWFDKGGLTASTPISVNTEFCNVLGVDCWNEIPLFYDTASAVSFGSDIANSLNVSNKAYIEYSNEVGNTGTPGSSWASVRAYAAGLNPDFGGLGSWYAYRTRTLFGAITAAWPVAQLSRLKRVGEEMVFSNIPLDNKYRFNGYEMTFDSNGNVTAGTSPISVTGTTSGSNLTATAASGRISQDMVLSGGTGSIANIRIRQPFNIATATGSPGGSQAGQNIYGLYSSAGTTTCNPCTLTPGSSYTAHISGGTALNVDSGGSGIKVGDYVFCQGCVYLTHITGGSAGAYTIAPSQSDIATETMWGPGGTGNAVVTDYTAVGNRPIDYMDTPSFSNYFQNANINVNYELLESTTHAVTNISSASPSVVTCTGCGAAFSNGDRVQLSGSFGIAALVGAWTTVSALSGDTFALSATTDSNGASITSNGYTGYTSSGTVDRILPCINGGSGCSGATYGLLNAADDYASGVTAQMTTALNWIDNDLRQGTRKNAAGTPVLGPDTFSTFQSGWPDDPNSLSFLPFYNNISGPSAFNKPAVDYEGGYEFMASNDGAGGGIASPMLAADAGKLGISVNYPNEIRSLMLAYENDDRFRQFYNDFYIMAGTFGIVPSQYTDYYMLPSYGSFSGYITSDGTLTVTTDSGVSIAPAALISAPGTAAGTIIQSQVTGSPLNGTGTYKVTPTGQTVGSAGTPVRFNISAQFNWGISVGDIYTPGLGSFTGIANFDAAP